MNKITRNKNINRVKNDQREVFKIFLYTILSGLILSGLYQLLDILNNNGVELIALELFLYLMIIMFGTIFVTTLMVTLIFVFFSVLAYFLIACDYILDKIFNKNNNTREN